MDMTNPTLATQWKFPSSSSDAIYITTRSADGTLSCTCMGWRVKKGDRPRECKHTREVSTRTAIAPAPAPKAVVPSRSVPAPMLASAMTSPVTGAEFDRTYSGWALEEKHDGHRVGVIVEASQVSAWSRPGAGGTALPRSLPDALVDAMRHLSPGIYDGELVVPGGNSWDVTALGSRLVFIAFDLLEVDGVDFKGCEYAERRAALIDQLRKLPAGQTSVTTVESVPASWAVVEKIWQRGGEGAILKKPGSKYRPGARAPEWVKVKSKNAAVLTIIGYEEGKNGPYSKLKIRDAAGIETTCKTLGNAMLAQITAAPDSFVGRRIVISYQQKTPSGKYRHGVFDHFAGEGE